MTRALVIGCAQGVFYEAEKALLAVPFDHIIAVNNIGCDYPGEIDSWATYHANRFEGWINKRQEKGYQPAKHYWTSTFGRKECQYELKLKPTQLKLQGGSSGLLGVYVADCIGAQEIVLAGIPMDAAAGHYDSDKPWNEANQHRPHWLAMPAELKAKVRSMSGWTREIFGAPEWYVEV